MPLQVFITGANRGLGLGFTQTYLQRGERVVAACRTPDKATALHDLYTEHSDRLHIVTLDLEQTDLLPQAANSIAALADGFDVVIQNAGIPHCGVWEQSENWGTLTPEGVLRVLQINAVSPLLLSQYLVPHLKAGGTLAAVSSYFGSVGGPKDDWMYNNFGYAASKAALNLWVHGLAVVLRPNQIRTVALDPGWVQTDMGGPNADLTIEQSVGGMVGVLDTLTPERSGKFLAWDGSESAW